MSQGRVSEPSSGSRTNPSLLIQQKLSARRAKRAAKAAEREKKSEALKEEGNLCFRSGDFHQALDKYQRAVAVHASQKPILLTNMAAAYLKLDMYYEASEAADKALSADPMSIKARYRRAMARKHMEMWTAADIDFRTVLTLDPDNTSAQDELAHIEERRSEMLPWDEADDMDNYSDYEAPALEDEAELGDSLSESSDCEHVGNGIPCKFYNRSECKNGQACRYSHAPDKKSERDALGRNVCRYYLIGVCKFGERCSYSHSKEYLLHKGWWSTAEGIEREGKLYNFSQMCNKAITDYNQQVKASGTSQTPKKKQPRSRGRGRGSRAASGSLKPTVYSSSTWDGYDSDDDYEHGMFGFTGSEVDELLCHGVKPWDDDAWDFLDALHNHYP